MEEAILIPYFMGSIPNSRIFLIIVENPGIDSRCFNAAASSGWIKSDGDILN